jgi:UPF0716 protein FxsA
MVRVGCEPPHPFTVETDLVLARLLFLFIVIPLIELTLLLLLAEATNWQFTLLLVVVTGGLGALLAKQQGLAAFRRIREDLRQARLPAESVLDAVLILIAATLLLTPGVLTDAFGFTLLIPPLRRRYKNWLLVWLRGRFRIKTRTTGRADGRTEVIDSYVIEGTQSPAQRDEEPPSRE